MRLSDFCLLKVLCIYFITSLAPLLANKVEFGIAEYAGAKQCATDAEKIGVKTCVSYYRVGSNSNLTYVNFPKDFKVTLAIKFPQDKDNIHADIVNGKYNSDLLKLASEIKSAQRAIRLRIMPEGNGWWNSDGAYYKNQTPQTYVEAFKYVAHFFKNELGTILEGIDLNLNSASFDHNKKALGVGDFKLFHPGKDFVDHVSFSVYNRCGTSKYHKKIDSFSTLFRPAYYSAIESFKDIPIGIAEVATSPYCGIKLLNWYINLFLSLKGEFKKVERVMFFFENVPAGESSNDIQTKWGEVLDKQAEAFRSLIIVSRTKSPSDHRQEKKIIGYKILSFDSNGWKFPWRLWANYSHYTKEASNPSSGPLSREPFGEAGSVFRMQGKQSAMWGLSPVLSVGPSFTFGYVQSPNELMWWNNLVTIGASLSASLALKKKQSKIGSLVLEFFHEKNLYTVDTPSHYEGAGSVLEGIRLGINLAGDWGK